MSDILTEIKNAGPDNLYKEYMRIITMVIGGRIMENEGEMKGVVTADLMDGVEMIILKPYHDMVWIASIRDAYTRNSKAGVTVIELVGKDVEYAREIDLEEAKKHEYVKLDNGYNRLNRLFKFEEHEEHGEPYGSVSFKLKDVLDEDGDHYYVEISDKLGLVLNSKADFNNRGRITKKSIKSLTGYDSVRLDAYIKTYKRSDVCQRIIDNAR
ncbi:hypothetical protein JHD46_05500 [Sulfurimonas sp. SAG-AH-194-C20]|nr:hypothetical protein [Sulfurimonas sp. SAG-AH-194-C20]MDF1879095.1 hypothetical protein [Sulfurimonas sp. SAG-AH-194-C20]